MDNTLLENLNRNFNPPLFKIKAFYRSRIKSHHNSLRSTIPKKWVDLDYIMADFLFACVISFVEEEKGLESRELNTQTLIYSFNEIKHIYEYAKKRSSDDYVDNYEQESILLEKIIRLRKYFFT